MMCASSSKGSSCRTETPPWKPPGTVRIDRRAALAATQPSIADMNLSNMRSNKVLVLLAALPFLAGCASQQQMRQYQDEIRSLREERTALKKDSRGLRMQLESYEVALADANAKLSQPSDKQYSALDALDIGYGVRGGQFVISVPSEITFASGRAELTRQG